MPGASPGTVRIDAYGWDGGREAMLRVGPADGPVVVVAPPLFEEANRTRAFLMGVLRRLAESGIGGILPDLPGTGESVRPTVETRLDHWRQAFAAAVAAAGKDVRIVALRGGGLVDAAVAARPRFHFDPIPGATIVRDLLRARRIARLAADEPVIADDPRAPGPPLMLAGNLIDRSLLVALLDAVPVPADRTYMLFPAHGSPHPTLKASRPVALWRASEPGDDPILADALADAIKAWIG
jgi:hypothetical protein